MWHIPLLIGLLLFGRWWHARIAHGEFVIPKEGIAIRRIQFLLTFYTWGVLCFLLLFFSFNYYLQRPQIIESTTAALLAGALYPIARIAQNRAPTWIVAVGFFSVSAGICLGATNLLTPLLACAWASVVGVIWLQALKSYAQAEV